jgi:hypothetical protein
VGFLIVFVKIVANEITADINDIKTDWMNRKADDHRKNHSKQV